MAIDTLETKVQEWDERRKEVRKGISAPQYSEMEGYFSELELMAFSSSFKKKEMEEKLILLRTFANRLANIDPDLSGSLGKFLSYCETLYGNPNFKQIAINNNWATELLKLADKEAKDKEEFEKEKRRRQEEATKRREEEARRKQEEESKKRQEEATKKREEETRRRQEEERKRKEERNTPSIRILDVTFADTDYNYNIIRPYGATLYTDVSYLVTKIKCEVLCTGPDLEVFYKLFSPSGKLFEAGISKSGYTNSSKVQCNSTGVFDVVFLGIGSDKKDVFNESGTWKIEFYENDKCIYKSQIDIHKSNPSGLIALGCLSSVFGLLATLGVIALVIWGVFKLFFSGSDGVRSYVYTTRTELYKSADNLSESNILTSLPYGTLVEVASQKGSLSEVEVEGKEGYVMGNMLLMEDDFKLLDGVWGNAMANECVSINRYRLAILHYVKASHIQTGKDGWQLMAKSMEILPNSVLYPNMNNGYDKFSDFAFVLTNSKTNEMRAAVYSFTDDGQPKLVHEEQAEKAYMYSVTYRKGVYRINYYSASSSGNAVKSSSNMAPKENTLQRSTVSSSEVSPVSGIKKTQVIEDNNIYDAVDTQAQFNGSVSGYIQKNMKYPAKAYMDGIKGTVIVSFVVEKTGEVSNVQVAKSAEPSLDREAVRLVKYMPLWSPAIKNGRKVRSRTSVSVVFE